MAVKKAPDNFIPVAIVVNFQLYTESLSPFQKTQNLQGLSHINTIVIGINREKVLPKWYLASNPVVVDSQHQGGLVGGQGGALGPIDIGFLEP